MKKGLVLVGFTLMSWAMAGTAFAGPFSRFNRPVHQQQRNVQQDEARDAEGNRDKDRGDKPGGNAAAQQAPAAGRNGFGEVGQSGNFGPGQQGRPGGRMSIEERQKLRRQINEAGRSLYTPPSNNK